MDLKTAKMSELVAAYNRLNPGRTAVTRFATRAVAERRLKESLAKHAAAAKSDSTTRVVRISGTTRGRPRTDFLVRLQEGSKMKISTKSLRRQIVDWLKARPKWSAKMSEIDSHFKRDLRGTVRQLIDAGWLSRSDV